MTDFKAKPTKPTGPWWDPEGWTSFPQVGDFLVLVKDGHPRGCCTVVKNTCGVWINGICDGQLFTDKWITSTDLGGLTVLLQQRYKLVPMDPPSEDCDGKPCLCWNMSLWEKNHKEQ